MELPLSGYLYTLAALAMTFVGFSAIVISLYQTSGKSPNIKLLRQHARGYIELGLSSVGAAMLAPLLAACGLSALLAWKWSSLVIAIGLTLHVYLVFKRFFTLAKGRIPMRVWINNVINGLVIVGLLANFSGIVAEPNAAPVAVAATWRLVHATIVFWLTYEDFLESN